MRITDTQCFANAAHLLEDRCEASAHAVEDPSGLRRENMRYGYIPKDNHIVYICKINNKMAPKIYNIKEPLNLERLRLAKPINKNGSHFIKTLDIDNPIYFISPKCFSKQGFVKSGKKVFCDFVFSNEDSDFLAWLENLEESAKKEIYNNRDTWFESPLDEHDIESSMSSPYKPYKSGKFFIVRANVPTTLDKINIKVYNENETETDPENIKENTKVIAVFEFQGIRCSVRSFQFEIELKQILIVEPEKLFETCIIGKTETPKVIVTNQVKVENTNEPEAITTLIEDVILVTPFRIEDAQSAAHSSLITTPKGGVLNEKRCKTDEPDTILTELESEPEQNCITNHHLENLEATSSDDKITDNIKVSSVITYDGKPSPVIPQTPHTNCSTISEATAFFTDIQDMPVPIEIIDDNFPLEDINDSHTEKEPPLRLKSRNDVYYKLYKEMRQRAKEAKREALANYLEAKRIKSTYLLEDLSESESDEDDLEDVEV